jgi:hypothetical protein
MWVTRQELCERGGIAMKEACQLGQCGHAKVNRLSDEIQAGRGKFTRARKRTQSFYTDVVLMTDSFGELLECRRAVWPEGGHGWLGREWSARAAPQASAGFRGHLYEFIGVGNIFADKLRIGNTSL